MVDLDACFEGVRDLVVVLDDGGTVRYQSPSVERVLGYDGGALVGEPYAEYVHPADRDRAEALLRVPDDTMADGDGGRTDGPIRYRFGHADGSWVDLETDGEVRRDPETGGAIVVSRDVAERLQLERDRERYEVILESIDDAVYAIREDGEIVYVNGSYASMKGVDREDLLGTQIYDWGSGEAGEKIRRAREEMEDAEEDVGVVEFEFSTVDGGSIPVEMRINTVTHPRDDLERTGVMRDVTERRARERDLQRKNERLEEFASILSHDLRNPLNVAPARVNLAIEGDSTENLESASSALSRIEDMIDDLLALARQGRAIEETERVDLAGVVEDAWRTTDTRSATLEIEDGARATIRADPDRLQNVVENLLRNSVEHSSTGSRPSADDSVEHGGPGVTVTVGGVEGGFFVEDDGPGVPPEERERVLEPGFTTRSEGTGFGLGIVAEIADAHGWEVSVVEGTDGGARFEFTGVAFADGESST